MKLRRVLLGVLLTGAAGAGLVVLRPGLGLSAWRLAGRALHHARLGFVEADGERVAILEVGSGPPLVLVHGLRGESVVMLPLAARLAARGWRVICIDLPGHGHSPDPKRPVDIGRAARVVRDVIRELGLERPPVVGHSLGGWITAWLALEEPGTVGPVGLVASAGLPFEPPPWPELLPRTTAEARRGLRLLFADPPPRVPAPLLWFASKRRVATSLDLLRSVLSGRYLLDGLLPGMAVPALVVAGEEDHIVPLPAAREMAAEIPGHRIEVVPETGHMLVIEAPDRVAEILDRFLREAGAATGTEVPVEARERAGS